MLDGHVVDAHCAGARPSLVELRRVRASYDSIEVLHGVDIAVEPGAVHALIGPNGAGKTTALKVLSGLHPASSGDVFVAGCRVNGVSPETLARAGLCLVPEGRGIFPNLTVRENLWMMTHSGRSKSEVEEVAFARFPRLAERGAQTAGTMSGGEQQMLALARGLATDPAVLVLDELSMGLAPLIVQQLYELVAEVAREGVAILVVEQFARVVLPIATTATVLAHGRVLGAGPPDELEDILMEAYLGS